MTVTTRAQWGAAPPKSRTAMGHAVGAAVHYEGSDLGPYPEAAVPAMLRSIQRDHMFSDRLAKGGGADIAYTYMVDRFGRVFEGRGFGVRSGANGTAKANAEYYAICVLIGPGDPVTDEIKAGVLEARSILMSKGCGSDVQPHQHFFATACPGAALNDWCVNSCPAPGIVANFPPPVPEQAAAQPALIDPNQDYYSLEAIVTAMPTIQQGATGQYAKIAQSLIVANGEPIAIDGQFGPQSAKALSSWQGKVGLDDDGVCGPKTWRRLHCI